MSGEWQLARCHRSPLMRTSNAFPNNRVEKGIGCRAAHAEGSHPGFYGTEEPWRLFKSVANLLVHFPGQSTCPNRKHTSITGLALGAADYLVKPVDFDKLVEA